MRIKELLSGDATHVVTWVVAFVGVCVLVGVGKLKPETIEYLLFAMGGAVASNRLSRPSSEDKDQEPK